MILDVPRDQADKILGSMRAVALAHGSGTMTEADRRTISGAARIVLGMAEPDPDRLTPCESADLAAATLSEEDARQAVRMLSVMSLVDGRADAEKAALVREYAAALAVEDDYLALLTEVAEGEVAAAAACIMRKNIASFPHMDHDLENDVAAFLPYADGNEDAALEARYETLAELPEQSFGRAFFEHFKRNGFCFPGNPKGLSEGFTTPHDSSHVLSGYSTTQAGEICVSTFIGAMHPDHPMAAEVLPVLYSWHDGVELTEVAGSYRGAMVPEKFWTAWDRGAATSVDVVDAGWDFWAATEVPLEELRDEYGVRPVDEALLA